MLSSLFFAFSIFMLMGIPVLVFICGAVGLCKACSHINTKQTVNLVGQS
ncbi:hypothetical protein QUF74_17485 [Candidatus Halobeggiatoa sp. HSG11]|nr:hypothetical protein [Candidatus Halobeggiatoa sp. HSG11]